MDSSPPITNGEMILLLQRRWDYVPERPVDPPSNRDTRTCKVCGGPIAWMEPHLEDLCDGGVLHDNDTEIKRLLDLKPMPATDFVGKTCVGCGDVIEDMEDHVLVDGHGNVLHDDRHCMIEFGHLGYKEE